jgi:hypothetical protein
VLGEGLLDLLHVDEPVPDEQRAEQKLAAGLAQRKAGRSFHPRLYRSEFAAP